MIALLIASASALLLALVGTPLFIRLLVRKSYGQFIRDDGPTAHHTKRGTPTMGGAVIVGSVVLSYFATHLIMMAGGGSDGPRRRWRVSAVRAAGFETTTRRGRAAARRR